MQINVNMVSNLCITTESGFQTNLRVKLLQLSHHLNNQNLLTCLSTRGLKVRGIGIHAKGWRRPRGTDCKDKLLAIQNLGSKALEGLNDSGKELFLRA